MNSPVRTKPQAVRAALRRGGAPELVATGRRWLAGQLYPGGIPAPPPPVAKPRKPAPPMVSAGDASFEALQKFFAPRRASYERLADAIAPYLPRDGVMFDIGGNVGYFTKVVTERCGFQGVVHLFEPVPRLAGYIPRTLEGLPLAALSVHAFGLGETDDSFQMWLGKGNLGWNTLIADRATEDMDETTVRIRRFDGLGLQVRPDLVKIDVEGAEYLVLRGLLGVLATWQPRPVLLCEIGWGTGHPDWEKELVVLDELLALGYRATDLDGAPIDLRAIERTTDVLFLPVERN
ncbi:FkbM family methyltransferase [Nocardioides sp. zg-536]|uniref:FkbM family methyltransferase n=1 Tax=Nocardioides faecalis TaxID=2803858 RepID=A0A938YBH4_9ACTN|nr:FkbM family methyltransferase [Nocardioides faecalis]MBM9460804.1 FkbM family methyltransferase [Nocardioides faecalis]QVI57994.1 FkbM family methyltransferase [Nocardioides faecalis]